MPNPGDNRNPHVALAAEAWSARRYSKPKSQPVSGPASHTPKHGPDFIAALNANLPSNNNAKTQDLIRKIECATRPGDILDAARAFTRAAMERRQPHVMDRSKCQALNEQQILVLDRLGDRLNAATANGAVARISKKPATFSQIYQALSRYHDNSHFAEEYYLANCRDELKAIYLQLFVPLSLSEAFKQMYSTTIRFNAVEAEWLRKMFFVCLYTPGKGMLLTRAALSFQFGYPHDFRDRIIGALQRLKVLDSPNKHRGKIPSDGHARRTQSNRSRPH